MKNFVFNVCREIVYLGSLIATKVYLYQTTQITVKDVLKQAAGNSVRASTPPFYYVLQSLLGFLACYGIYRLIKEIVNLVKSEAEKHSSRFKVHLKD